MSADHCRLLFEYHCWANKRVLDRAAQVPAADYCDSVPGLAFGSLHATLVHSLVAEIVWLARWQGRRPPRALSDAREARNQSETQIKSFEELRDRWRREEARQRQFFAGLTDPALTAAVAYQSSDGGRFEEPLEQLVSHFINHGTQFRSEAAVRLTELGRSPGDLDLIVFLRARE